MALSAPIGASDQELPPDLELDVRLRTVSMPAPFASATSCSTRALERPSSSPSVRRFSAQCRITPGAVICR